VWYTNSVFFFLLILITSCTTGEYNNVPTFTVSYTNFENSITIDGFVEPLMTSVVVCPVHTDGIITYLVEDGAYVQEGEIICKIEFQALQTDYENMQVYLENAEAFLNKTKADLELQYAILEAQVESNNVNTKIAELDSLQLIYSPPNLRKIKELELEKAAVQKKQFDKKLEALDIINQSEIRRLELQNQRLSNRIKSLKERLDALNVKSPKDGLAMISINRVTGLKNQVGDPIWSNMPILTIPELSEMKIKINASETDFKYINVGDSIVYTFDAMPENKAWGKILLKSPIGTPYKRGSKVKIFEVEASVDSVISMPVPGYTAFCRIILTEVKDTLVIPQVAIFEEDSLKFVYVKNKKGFDMRQVSTGLSSSKEIIVESGLRENEVVSLIKPDPSDIRKKVLLEQKMVQAENQTIVEENNDNEL